jgi:hypothetical protein
MTKSNKRITVTIGLVVCFALWLFGWPLSSLTWHLEPRVPIYIGGIVILIVALFMSAAHADKAKTEEKAARCEEAQRKDLIRRAEMERWQQTVLNDFKTRFPEAYEWAHNHPEADFYFFLKRDK